MPEASGTKNENTFNSGRFNVSTIGGLKKETHTAPANASSLYSSLTANSTSTSLPPDSTPPAPGSYGSDDTRGGLSKGAKAGVGVGVAIAVILLIPVLIAVVVRMRRRRKRAQREMMDVKPDVEEQWQEPPRAEAATKKKVTQEIDGTEVLRELDGAPAPLAVNSSPKELAGDPMVGEAEVLLKG